MHEVREKGRITMLLFNNEEGRNVMALIYGTGLVEDVRMKRDGGVGEAGVIYEGGAKEGVMEQEMEDVQY